MKRIWSLPECKICSILATFLVHFTKENQFWFFHLTVFSKLGFISHYTEFKDVFEHKNLLKTSFLHAMDRYAWFWVAEMDWKHDFTGWFCRLDVETQSWKYKPNSLRAGREQYGVKTNHLHFLNSLSWSKHAVQAVLRWYSSHKNQTYLISS